MNYEHKSLMEQLQSLDEPVKRRVLVAATGISMVIVVYFWLAYFNNLVASIAQPTVADTGTNPVDQTAQVVGITQTAVVGQNVPTAPSPSFLASIAGQFMNIAHGLGDILQAPRQYIIKPPQ